MHGDLKASQQASGEDEVPFPMPPTRSVWSEGELTLEQPGFELRRSASTDIFAADPLG